TRTRSTPSVSRLPRNQSSINDFSNYPSIPGRSPLPTTPLYAPPLPNTNSQPIDIFQKEPPQELNQEQIDEYQIRKNLGLTDKVYDSGLSRRPTLEIEPRDGNSTVDNSTQPRSYSQNLKLPPRRYQDKQENQQKNQVALTPNNSNTQTEKTAVVTTTPEAPPKPDPTKKNRLPEAPLVRQLREGKTIQDIVEPEKQSEKVAVVSPPPQTNNSELEVEVEVEVEKTSSPAPTPQPSPTPEQPKEFKGSLLDNFQKQRQQVAETTPTPKPSPKPEREIAAATVEETKPPIPEVKETPSIAPAPEPSPPVQQQEEFKGALLQKFEQQKQQNADVAEESESRDIALGAVGAYTLWAGELGLEEENLTPPQTISDVYPEAACERKLEGNALVGVLVGVDGAIERGPKMLVDSGYAVLDEAALDAVSKRSFESSERSKLYQYELSFDSSNCAAAQPTPEAESETAQPTEEGIPIEVMPPEEEQ
ncbi:MAG: energy transducer TonB, partial [Microcoleaceae cyanobacterium]